MRELKARVSTRVEQKIGPQALDRLDTSFVGTIHAYCFRLLLQQVRGTRPSMCLTSGG